MLYVLLSVDNIGFNFFKYLIDNIHSNHKYYQHLIYVFFGKIDDQAASTWCLLSIPGVAAGELLKNIR